MSIAERLRENPMFSSWNLDDIRALADLMEEAHFPEGQIIFDEKSPTNAVYIILSGRVNIYRMLHGTTNFLSILETHDIFGEVAFVDQKARSASALALDECRMAKFAYEHFEIVRKQNPALGMKFLQLLMVELAHKFRALTTGLDLKSTDHTVNELILSKQLVKITTTETEFYCVIQHMDRVSANPFLKIDVKGQVILLPLFNVRSITLPNKFGKF